MKHGNTDSYPFPLPSPQGIEGARDVLTAILRKGAQDLLGQAVHDEVAGYLAERADLVDADGHQQVVRNGYLPKRKVMTGIGSVEVHQPRVRDRRSVEAREKFTSSILPPYLRKTKSMEELLPWLYLKGISTGDFGEALAALLGENAKGLSATTITRLKLIWQQEYQEWSKRSLADTHYVYVWADGVHFNVRPYESRTNRRREAPPGGTISHRSRRCRDLCGTSRPGAIPPACPR